MANTFTRHAARVWRPAGLPRLAAWVWRAEWLVGLVLMGLGGLLFLSGLHQARTAPRENADAGMLGVIMGPLTTLLGAGMILAAVSLRVPGRWRWAGQAAAAIALLYLSAQCAT
jgi:hypothetical protein